MSDSLRPHESQHARPPCPSPTPGVYSNSCPLSQWCPSSHLILCHPPLLLPPISPNIGVFSNESTLCMRWPKYWSFSFNISPSNEHQGLISFRMDWLDLLAVQGTLKSLLQYHSSKASIFQRSAFFMVQLSNPYMTTGKTIALTRHDVYRSIILNSQKAETTQILSKWWMDKYNVNLFNDMFCNKKKLRTNVHYNIDKSLKFSVYSQYNILSIYQYAAMKLEDTCPLEEKLWPT